jgi:hypothetical protein
LVGNAGCSSPASPSLGTSRKCLSWRKSGIDLPVCRPYSMEWLLSGRSLCAEPHVYLVVRTRVGIPGLLPLSFGF